jgi:(E)-4-hydroxy-3-methylbut-2-enyl-diphosphate synthase
MSLIYNYSPFKYKRFQTREVKVGNVGIGGTNPIRIQSMTTSDTRDTKSTVRQILDLADAGCEIVRLTVPSQADAENLPSIRKELKKIDSKIPLVADIHFTPSVALYVVDYVEKVRINPGNFADKKKFAVREYTDSEYKLELERISELFIPLVKKCKSNGVAMRIGTNHGSLSDRIMNRYGDTPAGMCESALEFIRIAESCGFKDIVVSMKSSNPVVMVEAYRLLVSHFIEFNMNYPLHLGVTEAGNGTDGRIKSAIGIGSLLEDGIGDTIRVSLTEDAIHEIPVARKIARKYNELWKKELEKEKSIPVPNQIIVSETIPYSEFRNPFQYERRDTFAIPVGHFRIGEKYPVRVETALSIHNFYSDDIKEFYYSRNKSKDKVKFEIFSFLIQNEVELEKLCEMKKNLPPEICISVNLGAFDSRILEYSNKLINFEKVVCNPFHYNFRDKKFLEFINQLETLNKTIEFKLTSDDINLVPELLNVIKENENIIFSLETEEILLDYRKLAFHLKDTKFPILIFAKFENLEKALYPASIGLGGLLLDGIGDALRIVIDDAKFEDSLLFSFDILQAVRLRSVKTEFISCPSCGRTLFDLQETTAKIKQKTGHLDGVKIAIMGCIVNGPGEMADADFGYVGAGPGKVHLYFGKEIVSKSISSEDAPDKLIDLIKEKGKWKDP